MDESIHCFPWTVRTENILNNANIKTFGQLAQKTESEMLKYRNFGKNSLNEIKDKLQDIGLSLGMKVPPDTTELYDEYVELTKASALRAGLVDTAANFYQNSIKSYDSAVSDEIQAYKAYMNAIITSNLNKKTKKPK